MRRTFQALAVLACSLVAAGALPAQPKPGEPAKGAEKGMEKGAKLEASATVLGGKTLDQWIKDMTNNDPSARQAAIQMAPNFPDAKRAVPQLILAATFDKDLGNRANAAVAIGLIGLDDPKDIKNGVSALYRLLNERGSTRLEACLALGRIGPAAHEAVHPGLTNCAADLSAWEIRRAACFALGRCGYIREPGKPDDADDRAVAALIARVSVREEPSAVVRMEAIQALLVLAPSLKPGEISVISLAAQKDPDKLVKLWARVFLMKADKASFSEANLTSISKLLKSTDPQERSNAAIALGWFGADAKSKVGDLRAALKHEDANLVVSSLMSLGAMGRDAGAAALDIEKLINDHPSPAVRGAARQALDRINGKVNLQPPKKK